MGALLSLCSTEGTRGVSQGAEQTCRAWPGCCQAGAGSPKPAAPVRGEQSGQSVGSAGAAAQIPDLLPPPLSVLGAAKNP